MWGVLAHLVADGVLAARLELASAATRGIELGGAADDGVAVPAAAASATADDGLGVPVVRHVDADVRVCVVAVGGGGGGGAAGKSVMFSRGRSISKRRRGKE